MQFLTGAKKLEVIADILRAESDEIAVAVAFWGGDALDRLAVSEWKAKKVRLICAATSGACNPKALKELRDRFGPSLKTNSRLHAKVYWTPSKVLITSANASASGLSLEDNEVDGNIEAGLLVTLPETIVAVKKWFDELFQSRQTIDVDEKVLEEATLMWSRRRRGRSTQKSVPGLMEALKDKSILRDRRIFVVNYPNEDKSSEAIKRDEELERDWAKGTELPPAFVEEEISFDLIGSFESWPETLKDYRWNSWLIDLTDSAPRFWYVGNSKKKIQNKATVTIPVYGAKTLWFGSSPITITSGDLRELKKRWRDKIGKKNDEWEPLPKFAD